MKFPQSKVTNEKQRTLSQNNALHLYFELIATEMNLAGYDLRETLPKVDIPWSKDLVKEAIWKPIQLAWLKKESTIELTKSEVTEVYEIVNRWLSELKIEVEFPNIEHEI